MRFDDRDVEGLVSASREGLKFIQQVIDQRSFDLGDGIRAEVRLVDALNRLVIESKPDTHSVHNVGTEGQDEQE